MIEILEELTSEYDFSAFSILLNRLGCLFSLGILQSETKVLEAPLCATSRSQNRHIVSAKKIIIENRISLSFFL